MAVITGFWLYDFFALVAVVLAVVYVYFRSQYQTWKKRGFPVPLEPTFPYGNFEGVNRTRSLNLIPAEIYAAGEGEKIIGTYMMSKPVLIVRDMDLIKNILVKDFSSFHDRGFELDVKKDPLAGHIFLMKGQEWRNLRIQLTPTFTSGKMKMMFPTMLDVGVQLKQVLGDYARQEETEVKEILSRYTTDVISSVAFGLETNSLKNPDAEFRKIGHEMTNPTTWQLLMNLLAFAAPKLANALPFPLIPSHITKFFMDAVRDTMQYRIKNNVQRNDFLQLLIQLRELGYIKDADKDEKEAIADHTVEAQKFTFEQAAAQAFVFFFAGFETSSATMQFALYELALNPLLQEKLQAEIDEVLEKNDGKLTYEDVMHMDLLDRVVDETLRKYPVAAVLMRQCNKEYPITGTKLVLQPGDNLWFPVYAYHHDPKYYPNPETFDPDRFLPEVKKYRPNCAYMPFGEGPRNCIGNRFGLMQTKTGLALALSEFSFAPSKSTPIPLVLDPKMQILAPKGRMFLKVAKRDL